MKASNDGIPPPPPSPPTVTARSMGMSRDAPEHRDDESVVSTSYNEPSDPHATLVSVVQNSVSDEYRGPALAYLLNYETMVRQQGAEDMAVLAHIRPCVMRLLELVPHAHGATTAMHGGTETPFLTREISLAQLRRAVAQLDQRANDSNAPVIDFFTTDRQFMMVLRLLTSVPSTDDVTLTWAEFVQCYKVCIAGMVTLQHLPAATKGDSSARARARHRTLQMLHLFTDASTLAIAPVESAVVSPARLQELYAPLDLSPRGHKSFYKNSTATPETSSTVTSKMSWTSRSLVFMLVLALMLLVSPYVNDWASASRGRHHTLSSRLPLTRSKAVMKTPVASFLDPPRAHDTALDRTKVTAPEKSQIKSTTGTSPTAVMTLSINAATHRPTCDASCRSLLGVWVAFL